MMRVFLCVLLLLAALWLPLPIVLLAAALYAFRYTAYELIILGGCLDVYFGVTHIVPWYTLGACACICVSTFMKPRISWYRL